MRLKTTISTHLNKNIHLFERSENITNNKDQRIMYFVSKQMNNDGDWNKNDLLTFQKYALHSTLRYIAQI